MSAELVVTMIIRETMKNDLFLERCIKEPVPQNVKFYANDDGDMLVVIIFADGQVGIASPEREKMERGNRLLGSLIQAVTWLSKRGFTQGKYFALIGESK